MGRDHAASPCRHQPWVFTISRTDFFQPCQCASTQPRSHGRDVVVNFFCCDEGVGVCSICLPQHHGHQVLQIRRSSYHDVVKVSDISKLTDISGVQSYIINASKVVFLKRRPQSRPPKGAMGASKCIVCGRHLQDINAFCSLQCKTDTEAAGDPTLARLYAYNPPMPMASSSPAVSHTMSGSSPPGTPSRQETVRSSLRPTRDGHRFEESYSTVASSRRKGHPHRAPLW